MSERSKINRARREVKQEEQAKKVIRGIFIALIILAVLFMVYSTVM